MLYIALLQRLLLDWLISSRSLREITYAMECVDYVDCRPVFKVWSGNRVQKTMFKCQCCLESVILTACSLLAVHYSTGVTLVLEADGTKVENDEVLAAVKTETLMLLLPNERWEYRNDNITWRSFERHAPIRLYALYDWKQFYTFWSGLVLANDVATKNRNRIKDHCELACKTRALELYSVRERLQRQQKANNHSLMLAAVGGIAMVGGAAFTVASTPYVVAIGKAMYFCGAAAELVGLGGFLKTA